MAYTNAQLTRMLVGDVGLFSRDVTSGDGTTAEFYLAVPPILPASNQVYVGGSLKVEGADYSLDDDTGRLLFASPPAVGTGNIIAMYRAVQIPDGDVTEALRQQGLTASATADAGEPPAVLRAAVMLAEAMAARYASVGNVTLGGGGSLGQGGVADAWARRAEALRAKAATRTGLVAAPTTRVDGYSQDIKSTDVALTGENPRRRYYGQEDRLP